MMVGRDVAETGDQPLHRPEQHLHLQFGAAARVGEVAGDPRCGEREQQGRLERRLEHSGLAAEVLGLLATDPLDQLVDVGVRRQVRRDNPERRVAAGTATVERLEERQPIVVEARGRRDHGGPAGEQLLDHCGSDRPLAGSGHHGDVIGVGLGLRIFGRVGDLRVDPGVHLVSVRERLALPPGGLMADGLARADKLRADVVELVVDDVLVLEPQPRQVLASTGPSVVDEHRAALVECRGHHTQPIRTQFGADTFEHRGVVLGRCSELGLVRQAELLQDGLRGRGQSAGAPGELLGELSESCSVDHSASAAPADGRLAHRDALVGADFRDRSIDQGVDTVGVRRRLRDQVAQVATADADAVAATESDRNAGVQRPAGAELPHRGDAVLDVRRALANRPEHLADLVADGVGEHRTERLVAAGQRVHRRSERGHLGLCGAVDGTEAQFAADVEKQLVAPG